MENRTIYAAILGLGTVGTGTWKVLQAQKEEMQHKLGAVIEVKKILVRNTAKAAAKTGHPELVTDNWEEIELNQEWHGTKELFYEFYGVASTYLKEKFPHLMIGGYGSCGFCSLDGEGSKLANSSPRFAYFVEFFDGFIDYIKAIIAASKK